MAEFVVELGRLSTHCEFGAYLNDALRDHLVCGLSNGNYSKRLLAEKELTFQRACEVAQAMETANTNIKALQHSDTATHSSPTVNKVTPLKGLLNACVIVVVSLITLLLTVH